LDKNYYDDYRGWDLGLMLECLKNMRMPQGEFAEIGRKEKINMLILGSATPDNLFRIAQIDQYMWPFLNRLAPRARLKRPCSSKSNLFGKH
jgi:hypothetical protein